MERYAMQTAHVLLPQSRSMQDVYEKAYGLTSERMLVAPPPMDRILSSLRKGPSSENPESKNSRSLDFLNLTVGMRGSKSKETPSSFRLLVYGRVAKMKGAETVARAASILQDLLPSHLQLHLIFAGLDWPHPTEHRPTSEVVRDLIPAGFRGKIEFLGDTPRSSLVNLTRGVHGAVLASEFETFGLAAHELAALGVPLVISSIPAYGEFFPPSLAYVFKAGNATDLAAASIRLFSDIINGSPKVFAPNYDSAVVPYMRVLKYLRGQQGKGIQFSNNSDARLVKVAVDRLEAACWPSNPCAFDWGRQ
jgi:glycosyltransferase involved in cell wall biosynthesis